MLRQALGARKALPVFDLPDLKLAGFVNVEGFLVVPQAFVALSLAHVQTLASSPKSIDDWAAQIDFSP